MSYFTSVWACVTTPHGGHDLCNNIHIVHVISQVIDILQHHIAAASTCNSACSRGLATCPQMAQARAREYHYKGHDPCNTGP